MSRTKSAFRYLLAGLMLGAGTLHFVKSNFFTTIVPPYLPFPLELVYLSGLLEVTLGALLLVPRFSRAAAWGIIALLFAVFPANIYLYQHQELLPAAPMVHLLRLPLQGVFVWWAYWFTRPSPVGTMSCVAVDRGRRRRPRYSFPPRYHWVSGHFDSPARSGKAMELLLPLGLVVAWVILQAWVLPRFGVKT
jgi:uncharacterized membrane protein